MLKDTLSSIRKKFRAVPEIWFFVFMNAVFVIMYFWSIMITPALQQPATLLLFTVLLLIHAALHAVLLLVIGEDERWFWPYVFSQGVLAFIIIYLSGNIGMMYALYMGLIGEIIGTHRIKSKSIAAIAFYVALSLANQVIFSGTAEFQWWFLGTAMSVIFVVMYVNLFVAQSEARDRAQELLAELEAAHSQLTEYANQIEELTLTTERQRMARELHDTLAQGVAGLILQLEAADSHLENENPQKAQTIIQQAMIRARTTLADARRAIGNLRETSVIPTDLNEAIKESVDQFQKSTGIPCSLKLCHPPVVSQQLSENIMRAVSEGLMNIARHAEATEVFITMTCEDQQILIDIRDNGTGFDPEEAIRRSGHYGLVGIRERARLFGGTLMIDSQITQGTTLKLQLPLVQDD